MILYVFYFFSFSGHWRLNTDPWLFVRKIEAMMMLKKAWGEVTEQTNRNCFWKSGISLEAPESALDDHDYPFRRIMDDGEDDSAAD